MTSTGIADHPTADAVDTAAGLDLITATRRNLAERADAEALVFVTSTRDSVGTEGLSWAELIGRAQSLAAELADQSVAGDRVLLLLPNGIDFVVSFLACLYAELVPVPVPLPGRGSTARRRTTGVVADCGATLVLTDGPTRPEVQEWLTAEDLTELRCLTADAAAPVSVSRFRWPEVGRDTVAFLQYTSGSTSDPKGVVVSHGNLAANLDVMATAFEVGATDTTCSWLPVFHDMGLIGGLLLPIQVGARAVLMSPTDFVRRPARWLELMHSYRACLSFAPDFAYRLCTRVVTDEQLAGWDFSAWRSAVNGAEPIRPETMAAFADRFAAAGLARSTIRPGYGLAESTLLVSTTPIEDEPSVLRVDPDLLAAHEFRPTGTGVPIVSCGLPAGSDVRIVDPNTSAELPENSIGEIWLRGPSVAGGYWRNPEASRQIFQARTSAGEAGFLRTGDLGVLSGGELFVTGRIKDLLIINGRNVYPQDIEQEVGELDPAFEGLLGCAFAVPGAAVQDDIVVVQELRRSRLDAIGLAELAELVKTTLSRSLGFAVGSVVFVSPGKVPKTTSGKVQRAAARQAFLRCELAPVWEDVSEQLQARRQSLGGSEPR